MIVCRSQSEIAKLRRVNQLVARILAELRRNVAPGVTTRDLDMLAERLVREAGAEPADIITRRCSTPSARCSR